MKSIEEEISALSKISWGCMNIELSHLLSDSNNQLFMWYDHDQLKFRFVDNSKPYHYKEFVDSKIVEKIFKDKIKCIAYDYPYSKITKPARLIEDTIGVFGTGDYTFVKETEHNIPNFCEVERIIYKVLTQFNNNKNEKQKR